MPNVTRMLKNYVKGLLWLYFVLIRLMVASLEPGFLDFDNLPDTNFSCVGKVIGGYYADLETNCQMFHVCTIGQLDEPMDIRFLCLNGTVFDQETRVCERIDEVDCTKSEQFYSLNLELYGNTQPPILEETSETEPPLIIKSTTVATTTTTTERPRPKTKPQFYTTTHRPRPTPTHRQNIPSHHFPVNNNPDIRFNPEEINISLNPGAPPDIRTQPVSYRQQEFSDNLNSNNKKVLVTTHTAVYGDDDVNINRERPTATTEKPKSVVSYDLTHSKNSQQNNPTSNVHFGFNFHPANSNDNRNNFQSNSNQNYNYHYQSNIAHLRPPPVPNHSFINDQFRSSTLRNEYLPTTRKSFQLTKPTTSRNPFALSYKSDSSEDFEFTRTSKPQSVQLPIPVLPTLAPLTFSTPAPFTLSRHIETKRYTKDHPPPPRIIISASASVSDASGRKLNYSLGTLGAAQLLIQPPMSYDEYKDEDVASDPFYYDVPKIKQNLKRYATFIRNKRDILSDPETVLNNININNNHKRRNHYGYFENNFAANQPKIRKHRNKRETSTKEPNYSDIIRSEKEAIDVLKFLFEWYKNHKKSTTITIPIRPDIITEINDELSQALTANPTDEFEKSNNIINSSQNQLAQSSFEQDDYYQKNVNPAQSSNQTLDTLAEPEFNRTASYNTENQLRENLEDDYDDALQTERSQYKPITSKESEAINNNSFSNLNDYYYVDDNGEAVSDLRPPLQENSKDTTPLENSSQEEKPPEKINFDTYDYIDDNYEKYTYALEATSSRPKEMESTNTEISLENYTVSNFDNKEKEFSDKNAIEQKSIADNVYNSSNIQESYTGDKGLSNDTNTHLEKENQKYNFQEEYSDNYNNSNNSVYIPLEYQILQEKLALSRNKNNKANKTVSKEYNKEYNNTNNFFNYDDYVNDNGEVLPKKNENKFELVLQNNKQNDTTTYFKEYEGDIKPLPISNELRNLLRNSNKKTVLDSYPIKESSDKNNIYEETTISTTMPTKSSKTTIDHGRKSDTSKPSGRNRGRTFLENLFNYYKEQDVLGTTQTPPLTTSKSPFVETKFNEFNDKETNHYYTATTQTAPITTTVSTNEVEINSNSNIDKIFYENVDTTTDMTTLPFSTTDITSLIDNTNLLTTVLPKSDNLEIVLEHDKSQVDLKNISQLVENATIKSVDVHISSIPPISETSESTITPTTYIFIVHKNTESTENSTSDELFKTTTYPDISTFGSNTSETEKYISDIEDNTKSVAVMMKSNNLTIHIASLATNDSLIDLIDNVTTTEESVTDSSTFNSNITESNNVVENEPHDNLEVLTTIRALYGENRRGRGRFQQNAKKYLPKAQPSKSNSPRHRFSTENFTKKNKSNKNETSNNTTDSSSSPNHKESTFRTDATLEKSAIPTQAESFKGALLTTPLSPNLRMKMKIHKHFIFNCFDKPVNKFYSDPRDCRLFHYCTRGYTKNQLLDMKFVCDLGTYFDDEKLICTRELPTRCS